MPGHVERGFSPRKEEDDASFNVLEALAEHAADIFRDELLLEHLDPTTGSLLYNTSKKLRVPARPLPAHLCGEREKEVPKILDVPTRV